MSTPTGTPTSTPDAAIMRSLLGRARGLGSAKSGTRHWWVQRLTAIALVPLGVWFVIGVIAHAGASRAGIAHWMAGPVTAALMLALIACMFQHMQLGLQVVIEDYVHGETRRLASLVAMKAATALLAILAAISLLKLALSG
jgi:succinate dehydrogenase / fumarate reductase membrane anchor subunit